MRILVEIDLKGVEPNDVYKPNSGWFYEPGYINIHESFFKEVWTEDELEYSFKYIGQVHEEQPRP